LGQDRQGETGCVAGSQEATQKEGMSLIQLGASHGRLWLCLLNHLQRFVDGQAEALSGGWAAPQPCCRDGFESNGSVRAWDQNAGNNLYLDRAGHNAVARGPVEINKGNAELGAWDTDPRRLGRRGNLWFV